MRARARFPFGTPPFQQSHADAAEKRSARDAESRLAAIRSERAPTPQILVRRRDSDLALGLESAMEPRVVVEQLARPACDRRVAECAAAALVPLVAPSPTQLQDDADVDILPYEAIHAMPCPCPSPRLRLVGPATALLVESLSGVTLNLAGPPVSGAPSISSVDMGAVTTTVLLESASSLPDPCLPLANGSKDAVLQLLQTELAIALHNVENAGVTSQSLSAPCCFQKPAFASRIESVPASSGEMAPTSEISQRESCKCQGTQTDVSAHTFCGHSSMLPATGAPSEAADAKLQSPAAPEAQRGISVSKFSVSPEIGFGVRASEPLLPLCSAFLLHRPHVMDVTSHGVSVWSHLIARGSPTAALIQGHPNGNAVSAADEDRAFHSALPSPAQTETHDSRSFRLQSDAGRQGLPLPTAFDEAYRSLALLAKAVGSFS